MKRHHQTVFGKPNGNCFATCVACILDLEISDVPNCMSWDGDDWLAAFNVWLEQGYALRMICLKIEAAAAVGCLGNALCVASGQAARGLMHSVVWQNGKMVHDPHPDGTGLIADPEDFVVFMVTEPSTAIRADLIGAVA